MEFNALIQIVLRRWWLIVLPFVFSAVIALPELLGGSSAAPTGFTAEIRYSAAQRLDISQQDGDYADVWIASEYTVHALTDWVRSSSFRAEIEAALGDSEVALAGLGIAADNVRSVGVVYLSHARSESLSAIADAAVLVLSSRSQSYFPQFGGESAQVTILQQPAVAAAPPALTNRFAPFIRMGIALLIGIAVAFFAEYVDPTIYHRDDLRRLGLPIIASIPKERA